MASPVVEAAAPASAPAAGGDTDEDVSRQPLQEPTLSEPMMGVVKLFSLERGYGFISPEQKGHDVYVTRINVEKPRGLLRPGDRVVYQIQRSQRGPQAVHVKKVAADGTPDDSDEHIQDSPAKDTVEAILDTARRRAIDEVSKLNSPEAIAQKKRMEERMKELEVERAKAEAYKRKRAEALQAMMKQAEEARRAAHEAREAQLSAMSNQSSDSEPSPTPAKKPLPTTTGGLMDEKSLDVVRTVLHKQRRAYTVGEPKSPADLRDSPSPPTDKNSVEAEIRKVSKALRFHETEVSRLRRLLDDLKVLRMQIISHSSTIEQTQMNFLISTVIGNNSSVVSPADAARKAGVELPKHVLDTTKSHKRELRDGEDENTAEALPATFGSKYIRPVTTDDGPASEAAGPPRSDLPGISADIHSGSTEVRSPKASVPHKAVSFAENSASESSVVAAADTARLPRASSGSAGGESQVAAAPPLPPRYPKSSTTSPSARRTSMGPDSSETSLSSSASPSASRSPSSAVTFDAAAAALSALGLNSLASDGGVMLDFGSLDLDMESLTRDAVAAAMDHASSPTDGDGAAAERDDSFSGPVLEYNTGRRSDPAVSGSGSYGGNVSGDAPSVDGGSPFSDFEVSDDEDLPLP